MTRITAADIDDLALGAVFLATGGGGDPYVTALLAKAVLARSGGVEVLPPEALADDARVVAMGAVGAPSVSLELLPSEDDPEKALRAFEADQGQTVSALVAFEIGGGNSLIPLIAGARCNLPVIDGDGMGRALPEAQMMTFPIAGVAPTPALALDYAGNQAVFHSADAATYERHLRAVTQAMGGMVLTVEHPMDGATLKRAIIPHTLSFAQRLGALLRSHRGNGEQIAAALNALFEDSLYGAVAHLFTGKVLDHETRIEGGFDVGTATLEALDGSGHQLAIDIRNEYLVARSGDTILASVPDLITLLDLESAEPINAERLRFGQRVCVYGIGAPSFYRQPEALAVTAPRAFGFDFDYVPLETRLNRR